MITSLWVIDAVQLVLLPLSVAVASSPDGECTSTHASGLTCQPLLALRYAMIPFQLNGTGATSLTLPAFYLSAAVVVAVTVMIAWQVWWVAYGQARSAALRGGGGKGASVSLRARAHGGGSTNSWFVTSVRSLLLVASLSGVNALLWSVWDCYAPPASSLSASPLARRLEVADAGATTGVPAWVGGDLACTATGTYAALSVGSVILIILRLAVLLPTSALLTGADADACRPRAHRGASASTAAAAAAEASTKLAQGGAALLATSHGRVAAVMVLLRTAAAVLYFEGRHVLPPLLVAGGLAAVGALW